ncbi:MAG: hypothetical protein M1818_007438 [Claussenomyces sp. TS43310]|nr:MAG: hypothetical protein M1818_007438 [Claussenomyces sp. TS43310]
MHPPPMDRAERKELFQMCNENIPDHEMYLKKWFLGARLEDIKRENVKEFFLWAFFDREGPPGADDEELEEFVAATEERLGRKIEPGRGNAKCLRLTLDGVDTLPRSLVWYACVGFVDFLTYVSLLYHGFTFHRTALNRLFNLFPFRPQILLARRQSPVKYTTYWHRPHTSKTKLPVLFIHGIGIGLYPYVSLLNELNSTHGLESNDPNDQVGIIALEIMPVSFRLTHAALSKQAMCAEIQTILQHHGWNKIVVVSHSYGTVITTHLLKDAATQSMIGAVVLIDPVSILLHLPDVAYNFTRRKPQKANEHQLYYFASMDMGVSHTLSRHFFWSENILWKKDIEGHNVTVCLSGKDLIVDTEAVGTYLATSKPMTLTPTSSTSSAQLIDASPDVPPELPCGSDDESSEGSNSSSQHGVERWKERPWKGKGIDILWFNDLDHAQVLDKPATRRPLITAIRHYCAQEMTSSGEHASLLE